MNKYHIILKGTTIHNCIVEADTEAEAVKLAENGDGDITYEDDGLELVAVELDN